jgi:hypothetical protein
MSRFGKNQGPPKPSATALQIEEELVENNNTEVFTAMMQKASSLCFTACTNMTSGKVLSGTEKNCLHKCLKSYMEAQGIVGETYYKDVQERTNVSNIYDLNTLPRW